MATKIVGFPQYRDFEQNRIRINDAMMALLVGSRLGSHALTLSGGSPYLLGDMFPAVPEIERFNRSPEDAQRLIDEAERHLAYMGIPYTLAVYGGLLADCIAVLRDSGRDTDSDEPRDIPLSEIHQQFVSAAGRDMSALPSEHVELFELCRWIRNRIVHRDSRAGSRLPTHWRTGLTEKARTEWIRISNRAPEFAGPDGRMNLGSEELRSALAVTKHLAEVANEVMRDAVPRSAWCQIAIDHLRGARGGRRPNELRALRGFARMHYDALELTETEFREALRERDREDGRSAN